MMIRIEHATTQAWWEESDGQCPPPKTPPDETALSCEIAALWEMAGCSVLACPRMKVLAGGLNITVMTREVYWFWSRKVGTP